MGRKRKLTQEERQAKKIKRDRKYRKDKKAKFGELVTKNEQLEMKNEQLEMKEAAYLSEINSLKEKIENFEKEKEAAYLSGINSLKEKIEKFEKEKEAAYLSEISSLKKELSEVKDRADKLVREMSDESKKVKKAGKAIESGMLQLQQNILGSDDQEGRAENFDDIEMDYEYFDSLGLNMLGGFSAWHPQSSKTKGTTIVKAKLPPPLLETVNVNGFNVRKENSPMIQKIFSQYPNIASGLQVHHLELRDCFMDTLAEVYKMVIEEKHTLEEIKSMEEGIKDLELAGLEISWLKDQVKVPREVVRKGKKKH